MAGGANRLEQIVAAWTAPPVWAAKVTILNFFGGVASERIKSFSHFHLSRSFMSSASPCQISLFLTDNTHTRTKTNTHGSPRTHTVALTRTHTHSSSKTHTHTYTKYLSHKCQTSAVVHNKQTHPRTKRFCMFRNKQTRGRLFTGVPASQRRPGHGTHEGAKGEAKTHADALINVWSALLRPLRRLISEPSKTFFPSKCSCTG